MSAQMKDRPDFELFKEYLKEAVAEKAGISVLDGYRWISIGDESKREEILQSLQKRLKDEYGVELVYREDLLFTDLPFESVAIQLHHVYSTIYLMERINNKIRNRKN